jgi:hypothetical protein
VWGKRDIKTAQNLRKRLKRLGIIYERIAAGFSQDMLFLEEIV